MFERLIYVFTDTWRSIYLNCIILLVISAMTLSFAALLKNISGFTEIFLGMNQYTVYFTQDANKFDISRFNAELERRSNITEIKQFNSDAVKREITESFPDISEQLTAISFQEFPPYVDFQFVRTDAEEIKKSIKLFQSFKFVDQIIGMNEQSEELNMVLNHIHLGSYGMEFLVILLLTFGSYMLIQQNIFLQYEEIRVMRLLGAGFFQTMRPYIAHSMLVSMGLYIMSVFMSMLIFGLFLGLISDASNRDVILSSSEFLSNQEILVSLAGIMLCGIFGGILSGYKNIIQIEKMFI